jgi:hypothetical protein
MATPAVGEDIDALCGQCGQVWHVVMAKMGERIAKVVCKRCGGHHLYRTENSADAAANKKAGVRPRAARATRAVAEPIAAPIPAFDPGKPPRPYSVRDAFAPGERVLHSQFGTGVVVASAGPGKVEIAFPAGRRVLASARAVSTLERPVLSMNVPIADRPPGKP